MSRFAVVYEDPDYDDSSYFDDSEFYVEEGVVKPFDQWNTSAQARLMADVVKKPQDPWTSIEDPHMVS